MSESTSIATTDAVDCNTEFALEAFRQVNEKREIISASDQQDICRRYERQVFASDIDLIADGVDVETAKNLTLERIGFYREVLRFQEDADELFHEVEARKAKAILETTKSV
ncbi:hypothetical protein B0H15DRAFT_799773 [Mycena belliarum]|uniref:Uncharacterized protein n=1 Tax=Mycena belliarum TaxID=1033014 RepID=A0AAD6XW52_9AGAR|nr:hypothetical protein B0H15DRAFT_799773 [Mycena belliae]